MAAHTTPIKLHKVTPHLKYTLLSCDDEKELSRAVNIDIERPVIAVE